MHTFEYGADTIIHYNSDFSGNAIIVNKYEKKSVEISCEALVAFVADHIRKSKISVIENMTDEEILKLGVTK